MTLMYVYNQWRSIYDTHVYIQPMEQVDMTLMYVYKQWRGMYDTHVCTQAMERYI